MDNNFFDDINNLTIDISNDLKDLSVSDISDAKKNNKISTSDINKIKKSILTTQKKLSEGLNQLTDLVNFINSIQNVEKVHVPKTVTNQKRIKVDYIHKSFAEKHLNNCELTDETFIKSVLKQIYFDKSGHLIVSTKNLNVTDILNISEYDIDIINLARTYNKIGLIPSIKDIPTLVKSLETRHETVLHGGQAINLNNINVIRSNPDLFSTIPIFNKEDKYIINGSFCETLREYGINISLNKSMKSKAIDDVFKKYLTNYKKLYLKIDIQFKKYIEIINNSNGDNYLIHNNVIYMNSNKFDEVIKSAKNPNNSLEFNDQIIAEFIKESIAKYTIPAFKHKIDSSYK